MWRVAEARERRFGGPYAFVTLAQRLHASSAVLVVDDEVVAYLLADPAGDTLHVVDFEAQREHFTRRVLFELADLAVQSSSASFVEVPSSLVARLDVERGPSLRKTLPPSPPVMEAVAT